MADVATPRVARHEPRTHIHSSTNGQERRGNREIYLSPTRTVVVSSLTISVLSLLSGGLVGGAIEGIQAVVETATGWPGIGIVFVYSFLIAFALPGPSEVVLAAPLDITDSRTLTLGIIVLTSAIGKALGSLVAFHLGREVKNSGPVIRWIERSRFDIIAWSERRTVELTQKYGYVGLGLALCVPFFPDTVSIYAFAALEESYTRFALATFFGSIGRLLVTIGVFGGAAAVL